MNPVTHRLEKFDPAREDQKRWWQLDIGEKIDIKGLKFEVVAVDVVKQRIKLKPVFKTG